MEKIHLQEKYIIMQVVLKKNRNLNLKINGKGKKYYWYNGNLSFEDY